MEALGAIKTKQYYSKEYESEIVNYSINVKDSLNKYKDIYETLIEE